MRAVRNEGLSLVEALAAVAVIAILALAVLPTAGDLRRAGLAAAGARQLAVTFQSLRWKSVSLSRHHGLFFRQLEGGWAWYVVADGNGNGLRTAEVLDGVDETVSGPHRFEDSLAPVALGFPAGMDLPRIPPRRGRLDNLDDPVKFGRSDLVSFSPQGSASSGTVYLSDGRHEVCGVVLFGPTARIRVWRFDRRTGRWKL